jgi:hypothetical protein
MPRLPTLSENFSPSHSPSASFASHSPLESSFLMHRRRESLPSGPDPDRRSRGGRCPSEFPQTSKQPNGP